MRQIVWENESYNEIKKYLLQCEVKRVMLVCGKSFEKLQICDFLKTVSEETGIVFYRFSDYQPNPDYSSVVSGVQLFHEKCCDGIIAVGGGSAIDVAKCIKVFSNLDTKQHYLSQEIKGCDVPLLVVPTTAGTGSEATQFAVIYWQGEKQSVSHESCIPNAVFLDADVLDSLSDYQKKATMLDALCHGIESYWCIHSTEESRKLADQSIRMIRKNYQAYINGDRNVNRELLRAANMAGKAIQITRTTAAHAMSYKLTKLYGAAHGQAAFVCLIHLWKFMREHTENCADTRGKQYVEDIFKQIADALGAENVDEAILKLGEIMQEWNMQIAIKETDLMELVQCVNVSRLKNNPISLSEEDIRTIYCSFN